MKKLLILGGKPIASCDIVNYAKEIGVHTIVTDNLSKEDSPAKQIANETWDVSTADTERLYELCYQHKVDAVFTGVHEFNISKTLELANKCNFPFYASNKQLEITTVKSLYKKLFSDFDIPVVPEYSFDRLDEIEYPVLVKPVDGSGGYGISICKDKKDLIKAIELAKNHSSKEEFLIEKYIDNKEVTIFYVLQNGNIYLSAMADRQTYKFKDGVIPLPVQYDFPSKHLDKFIKNQNLKTIKAFESVGLKNGMLFIQAFVNDNKLIYYDIGYRLTGTQEYNIIELVNGYNPLKMLVDFSLTGQMGKVDIGSLVDPYFNEKYACNITFLSKPGKIARFIGIEEIKNQKGIVKTVINHDIGETIPESAVGTLNQVVFRVFGIADNYDEYLKLISFAKSHFDVISENDESLLIRDKFDNL